MKAPCEPRAIIPGHPVEVREGAGGLVEFRGYATVYDYPYAVNGGPELGGWNETISRGAAKRTLNYLSSMLQSGSDAPDPKFYMNHRGPALARYKDGTLQLQEDEYGLAVVARMNPLRPSVQEVRYGVQDGTLDAMSFAFRVPQGRSIWNDDFTERRITEFDLSGPGTDVSVVDDPANPATVAQIRAAAKIDELRSAAARPGMSLEYIKAIAAQIRSHA